MLDAHCHLDHYPNPTAVAEMAAKRNVFVIAVTNLPSHFEAGCPHVINLKKVRLALGLHPLVADEHGREFTIFERCFDKTSFIGEVGLDFSRGGIATKERQLSTFNRVAELLAKSPKFVSIHSRRAEKAVLDILRQHRVPPCVFHWYSGPIGVLEEIVADGHYFSVNPSMLTSDNGRKILEAIPRERLLTETDGPFGKAEGRPAEPWDVKYIHQFIDLLTGGKQGALERDVWKNFQVLLRTVGVMRGTE